MKNGKEMMRALCLPYKRMEDEQMLAELKRANSYTTTENGAMTYQSTMSDCLDLFATIGALRHEDETEITARFIRAYAENADIAMKILFFARDIREGLGDLARATSRAGAPVRRWHCASRFCEEKYIIDCSVRTL